MSSTSITQPTSIGTKLTLMRAQGRGASLVRLDGTIDESLQIEALVAAIRGATVLDLDGVRRITSFGVRQWIQVLERAAAPCFFMRCRPAMVTQFNTVNNFGTNGQLVSFYIPYLCPACGTDVEALVDLRTQHASIASFTAPPQACPKCGSAAEFDDLPEVYFSFVAAQPAPQPPPAVQAVIDNDPAAFAAHLKLEKEVLEGLTVLNISGSLDGEARFKRLVSGLEGTVLAMLSQVGQVTPQGIDEMLAAFEQEPLSLFLSDVPMGFVQAWTSAQLASSGARVARVHVPFHCAACGPFENPVSLDAKRARAWAQQQADASVTCGKCGAPALLSLSAGDMAAVVALPWADPEPPAVRAYLDLAVHAAGVTRTTQVGADHGALGKYQLVRKLGKGGMAEVFLARQMGPLGFEKRVVVKRILPHHTSDHEFLQMFMHEARVAALISHPNVVQTFDFGEHAGEYFIAMEYVPGWDLKALLNVAERAKVSIPVGVALRIVMDVAAGLHAAHTLSSDKGERLSLVHRDVSPHNVLVSQDGLVKVADFGVAKVMGGSNAGTSPGVLKGKTQYLAPELLSSRGAQVDARVDIFALGVMAHEMLSGQTLFKREFDAATLSAVLHSPIPRLSSRRNDVSAALDAIIGKALERRVEQRYATALELRDDVEELARQEQLAASTSDVADWTASLMGTNKGEEAPGHAPIPELTSSTASIRRRSKP